MPQANVSHQAQIELTLQAVGLPYRHDIPNALIMMFNTAARTARTIEKTEWDLMVDRGKAGLRVALASVLLSLGLDPTNGELTDWTVVMTSQTFLESLLKPLIEQTPSTFEGLRRHGFFYTLFDIIPPLSGADANADLDQDFAAFESIVQLVRLVFSDTMLRASFEQASGRRGHVLPGPAPVNDENDDHKGGLPKNSNMGTFHMGDGHLEFDQETPFQRKNREVTPKCPLGAGRFKADTITCFQIKPLRRLGKGKSAPEENVVSLDTKE